MENLDFYLLQYCIILIRKLVDDTHTLEPYSRQGRKLAWCSNGPTNTTAGLLGRSRWRRSTRRASSVPWPVKSTASWSPAQTACLTMSLASCLYKKKKIKSCYFFYWNINLFFYFCVWLKLFIWSEAIWDVSTCVYGTCRNDRKFFLVILLLFFSRQQGRPVIALVTNIWNKLMGPLVFHVIVQTCL